MSGEASSKIEKRWHGISVSDGAATGRVLRIHAGARYVYRTTLDEAETEREIERFRAAIEISRRQLLSIKERAERELGADHAYIFDAHLLMLEDGKMLKDVEELIHRQRVNAEWAVKVATDRFIAVYAEVRDEYLRERGSDIEDVARRLLVALSRETSGDGSSEANRVVNRRLTEDAVIVAEEVLPSAIVEVDFARVRAIASDTGGWTSHTAIIARGLGIPAVVGLRDLYRNARTGDLVVVNAYTGEVTLHPTVETIGNLKSTMSAVVAAAADTSDEQSTEVEETSAPSKIARRPLMTGDGVEITLRANVELPVEYEGVQRFKACGIGLYRTEFLWTQHGQMPSEEEQFVAYSEIAELAGSEGATIRFFDLGGDKIGLTPSTDDAERNPALGLRAIRLSLQHEEILRTQARASLRASASARAPLRVVLPMISDVAEVHRARKIIDEEQSRLTSEGFAVGELQIGAMIEVPSAVLIADRLARTVDFFSLGTNDLVQYMLAVDRGNDEVADWFRTLHPAVLESIRRAIEAARANNIPAIVCGEMAATPVYAVVLIGLGARELSMTPSSLPRVRHTIKNIDAESARRIADECLTCETASDVERLVSERLGTRWPHLFPPQSLPTQ